MASAQIRRLDPSEYVALIQALGDTPETVIAVHQLRHGLCEAYVEAGSGRHDAVILRPCRPSDELTGIGTDAGSLCRVFRVSPARPACAWRTGSPVGSVRSWRPN